MIESNTFRAIIGTRTFSSKFPCVPAMLTAVAALYVAKEILLPVALAILLSFLLTPLANRLERWRFPRLFAVLVVAGLSFSILGGVGWSLGSFDGLLSMRYIHKLKIVDADGGPGIVPLNVPHRTYFNLTVGYELPTKTKMTVIWSRCDGMVPGARQARIAGVDEIVYDDLGHLSMLASKKVATDVLRRLAE